MSGSPASYKPLDPGRVGTMDLADCAYWSAEFQITEVELQQAVAEAGNHVSAVRYHLESLHEGKASPRS
jgi:hypothetical protein